MKRFAYARISQGGVPEIRVIEAEDVLDASRKAVISEYAETISQDTSAVSIGCSALTTPKQVVIIFRFGVRGSQCLLRFFL